MRNFSRVFIIGEKGSGKSTLINTIMQRKILDDLGANYRVKNNLNNIIIKNNLYLQFVECSKAKNKKIKTDSKNFIDINFICIIFDLLRIDIIENFFIKKSIFKDKNQVIIILNKIDLIKKKECIFYIMNKFKENKFKNIFIISSINNDGVQDITKVLFNQIDNYKKNNNTTYINRCNIKESFFNILEGEFNKIFKKNVNTNIKGKINFWDENKNIIVIGFDIIIEKDKAKKKLLKSRAERIKNMNINIKIKLEKLIKKKIYLYSFIKVKSV